MEWYHYLAYFASGLLFVNAIPHLVKGLAGEKFQSPFAKPPGRGLSSPAVNVLWAWANLIVAYLLYEGVGEFVWGFNGAVGTLGVGAIVMSLLCARHFGSLR